MKRADAIEYLKANNLNVTSSMKYIERVIKNHGTSWQVVELEFSTEADENKVDYVPNGYRKCTTGEYVPHAYRRNFGWKNTFYQSALLRIELSCKMFAE